MYMTFLLLSVEMISSKLNILKLSILVNTKQEQWIKCDIGLETELQDNAQ
jgi:hypothetical protein